MSRASSTDSFVRSASQLSVVETEVQPETIVGDLRPPFANPLCSGMEVDMRDVDKVCFCSPRLYFPCECQLNLHAFSQSVQRRHLSARRSSRRYLIPDHLRIHFPLTRRP